MQILGAAFLPNSSIAESDGCTVALMERAINEELKVHSGGNVVATAWLDSNGLIIRVFTITDDERGPFNTLLGQME